MKITKDTILDVCVEPYGSGATHYGIYYRISKKNFKWYELIWKLIFSNPFSWKKPYYFYTVGFPHNFDWSTKQPYLYRNFDSAKEHAKQIKDNPLLIVEMKKKYKEDYAKAKKENDRYFAERNKSITL